MDIALWLQLISTVVTINIIFSVNIKEAVSKKEKLWKENPWGVQKSTKAVGPCNNWWFSVGRIPNLSLMNISPGAHQGEWPCTPSPIGSPSAGLCAESSPSLSPSAYWWTLFCSLSQDWGLCWMHSTYVSILFIHLQQQETQVPYISDIWNLLVSGSNGNAHHY